MDSEEAARLISGGVGPQDGAWAELGAGSGTFVQALARLLGAGATVYAVDKSARAVQALRRLRAELAGEEGAADVRPLQGDFTEPLALTSALDGVLMANALHFVEAEGQARVLQRAAGHVRPGGRLLVVEYDRVRANRWVPFPVRPERLRALAAEAGGLTPPREVGRRRSSYGREMYAALMRRQDNA